ncbi:MAG: hypothetical protein ACREBB_09460 [Nitrosotalea sp.]
MKPLHLSIITAAGIGSVVTLGIVLMFTMHSFNTVQPNTANYPESMLLLNVSMNSTQLRTGQGIGMDISLANTATHALTINPEHNWPLKKWSLLPCLFHLPFGMALLQGDYTVDNMTQGNKLPLYHSGIYLCKTIGIVDYVFEPSSTQATIETYNATNYPVTMQYHVAFNGYYQNHRFQPLVPGVYTVVGDDEWGHISVNHFTVTNTS